MEKGTIGVLIPAAGPIEPEVMASAMLMSCFACNNGKPVLYVIPAIRSDISTARNALATGFLEKTDAEWAFWMDSDMLFPVETIALMLHRAVEFNLKFCTGIYFQRNKTSKHLPLIFKRDQIDMNGKAILTYPDEYSLSPVIPGVGYRTPFEIDACGFGCVLIHRDVFAEIEKPYFKFHYYDPQRPEKFTSEDFYFCYKARKKGIPIHVIPEIECGHLGDRYVVTRKDFEPETEIERVEIQVKKAEAVGVQ